MTIRFGFGFCALAACLSANAATFTVTVTNDSGIGSLRQAILDANGSVGADLIDFNIATATLISPASALPIIADPVTIDGATQPGFAGVPLIEIQGLSAGAAVDGLRISAGSCTIRSLIINRFPGDGIELMTNGNNLIEGCYIGTGAFGTNDLGNTLSGIFATNSAFNVIGGTNATNRNIISGNNQQGVHIGGINSFGNQVLGNIIGLAVNGSNNVPNSQNGVLVFNARSNLIGGTVAGSRNVISSNTVSGVRIENPGAWANQILGNYIGLEITGTTNRGNGANGVHLINAPSNFVGNATSDGRNVISGNSTAGIRIETATTNVVQGNYIGTDATGLLDRGNVQDGIILINATNAVIGGVSAGEANLISGNNDDGIELNGAGSAFVRVHGNLIGSDVTGTNALGNSGHGVQFASNARTNTIGGIGAGEGNTISFNALDGVFVGSGTNNTIRGNSIYSNTNSLGIDVAANGVTGNDTGDADTGANETQNFPVLLSATNTPTETTVIGTLNSRASTSFELDFYSSVAADATGSGEGQVYLGSTNVTTDGGGNGGFTAVLPVTTLTGRFISATATDPFGNTSEFSTNVAAVSTVAGVTYLVTTTNDTGAGSLRDAIGLANTNLSANDVIAFNIGTATLISPVSALPIISDSVTIDGATQPGFAGVPLIEINGASAGAAADGLRISAGGCTIRSLIINRFLGDGIELMTNGNNLIEGCYLGTDATGTNDLGNTLSGVFATNSAFNVIGGTNGTNRNVISGNNQQGVHLGGTNSFGNQVLGNFIGLGAVGSNAVANSQNGVLVFNARSNIIGGTISGARNFISGNTSDGIELTSATNNTILGNYLGTDVSGTLDLGNGADGVQVNTSSRGNVIGGTATGAGNLISGNNSDGIELATGATTNQILGNIIGANLTGTNALANTAHGVNLSTTNNTIGGVTAGAGNTLAFNGGDGVFVPSGSNNVIRGNSHFSNTGLGLDLGTDGVTVNDTGDADATANLLQNFPVLASATNTGIDTTIIGTLNSRASAAFDLDFYASVAADATGVGEGQVYLGSTNVVTDGSGNVSFTAVLPVATLIGRFITATVTDPFGNTSEFSTNVAALSLVSGTTYIVTTTNDSGTGSLREAIGLANTNLSANDTITFSIPGAGVQVIRPLTALPVVIDRVTIDGTTQPGASCATTATNFDGTILIRIDGTGLPAGSDGLRFSASGNTVRGLQIVGYSGDGLEFTNGVGSVVECSLIGITHTNTALANGNGIHFNTSGGNRVGGTNASQRNVISGNTTSGIRIAGASSSFNEILGNFIGLQLSGATNRANGADGILISTSHSNTIGGTISGSRNYISGNTGDGMEINTSTNNTVLGNYLGTDVSGTLDLGNTIAGVLLNGSSSFNLIGGDTAAARNLISGNNGGGVQINSAPSTLNQVLGNWIGVNATGTNALPNTGHGVEITAGRGNVIGGTNSGAGNVIAFNTLDGVNNPTATHTNNVIRGNSIYSNGDLGIDLAVAGVTGNDTGDADAGANFSQNFPVLTAVTNSGAGTEIWGTLNSAAGTTFSLDFYSSVAADPTGLGEGQFYLGSTNVTTDGGGNMSFVVTLPVLTLTGRFISATATDPFGNTSEFSTNSVAVSTVVGATYIVTTTNDSGAGSLREAIQLANANISALDTITFSIPGAGVQVIQPATALPLVSDPVTFDGTTQPGASGPTSPTNFDGTILIRLVGTGLPAGTDGLRFTLGGNTVRGLQIVGFAGANSDGLEFTNGVGNVIECNLIGITDTNTALANNVGVHFNTSGGNRVGGTNAAQRNVISGNSTSGLRITGASSSFNEVLGNFIGLQLSGATNRPNGNDGILITGSHSNVIGGTIAGSRNYISGNNSQGLEISGSSTNNAVLGNYVGTDVSGTLDLGNTADGILISAASFNRIGGVGAGNLISGNNGDGVQISSTSVGNELFGNIIGADVTGLGGRANNGSGVNIAAGSTNTVGGVAAGAGNLIAFNGADGVVVSGATTTNNAVRGNSIFSNGTTTAELGIELSGSNGVNANDAGDTDTGANRLQNFPLLSTATNSLSGTEIWGALNSTASTTFDLDFYSNVACDTAGHGEGQVYLGSGTASTDGGGNVSFTITVPTVTLVGRYLTATATDPFKNTSEFSPCLAVVSTIAGATYTVVNTNDAGSGSLRDAITQANTNISALDTIEFSIASAGVKVIRPLTALPTIIDAVTIDGTTQPGASCPASSTVFDGTVLIRLDGTGLPASTDGLRFTIGDNTVRGLQIVNFSGDGIELAGGNGSVIECNLIGISEAGADLGNANGIHLSASGGNRIGGTNAAAKNVISGNSTGARAASSVSSFNQVLGNIIGLNLTGSAIVANSDGVFLSTSHSNTVGGAVASARNVISGNAVGVQISSSSTNNLIQGNYIGTDVTGTLDLGQTGDGVNISASALNTVGGAGAGEGNVISGNGSDGVEIATSGSVTNRVLGNRIGTDLTGALALGNNVNGVLISANVRDSIIGAVGAGNLIAFNGGDGVAIANNTATTNHAIRANLIYSNGDLAIDLGANGVTSNDANDTDTGVNGLQNFPVLTAATNTTNGVTIEGTLNSRPSTSYEIDFFSTTLPDASGHGEAQQYLGSTTAVTDGSGNVSFSAAFGTVLTNRYVTASATDPLGNSSELALCLAAASTIASSNFVVITNADSGAGSLREAILLANSWISESNDTISFNISGAGPRTISPTSALPIISDGVTIDGLTQPGASANTLSNGHDAVLLIRLIGSSAGAGVDGLSVQASGTVIRGLMIGGWGGDGVEISRGSGSTVAGCHIGLEVDGTTLAANASAGVRITSTLTGGNTVGGTTVGARNLISGNAYGVLVSSSPLNTMAGNCIGTDAGGTLDRGNSVNGIYLLNSSSNVIGGTVGFSGNLISGNGDGSINDHGIDIDNGGFNRIEGNRIGTTASGTAALPNTGAGINFDGTAGTNTIGGSSAAARNLISGNFARGIDLISSSARGNVIQGNYVGTDLTGTTAIPNFNGGVEVTALDTTIGGSGAGEGNLLSGNSGNGLSIGCCSGNNTVVRGNKIGTDVTGTLALPNSAEGIYVFSDVNTLGGTNAGEGNLIAFNTGGGIAVYSGADRTAILGNSIHSNTGLGIDLNDNGVTLNDAGDPDTGANNLQNYPALSRAAIGPVDTQVAGTLNSRSNSSYRLEFFLNTAADSSGYGEGQTFLVATNVTTDASGNAPIDVTFAGLLTTNSFITATATDTNNNTSEFSASRRLVVFDTVDLALAMTESADPAAIVSNVTYTITITNNGPTNATGVFVTNTLPAGVAVLSSTPSQGTCSSNNGMVVCNLGTINDQAGASVMLVLAPLATGFITNSALVVSTEVDNDPTNNTATQSTFVGVADLQITRALSTNAPVAGQPLSYLVGVSNQGPDTVSSATLYYNVDSFNTVVVGGSISQGSFSQLSGSFTASFGAVAAGATATLTINVLPIEAVTIFDNGSITLPEYDAFTGNGRSFTNGSVTVLGGTGVVEFAESQYFVNESGGSVLLTVQRLGGSAGTVTVDFATSNLTATAGSDFTATNATLTFTNGETVKIIAVSITEDFTPECNEDFAAWLSNPTGGAVILRNTNTLVTLFDNDFTLTGDLAVASRAGTNVITTAIWDDSYQPSISADGRYVAFYSGAINLTTNFTDYNNNVFVRDLQAGTTVLASVNAGGTDGGNDGTGFPQISGDGRTVVFESYASDMVAGDTNGVRDVFARVLTNSTPVLVSVSTNGGPANDQSWLDLAYGSFGLHAVSTNGRIVLFRSPATDLTPGVTNGLGLSHIYARDLASNQTSLVSIDLAGTGEASHSSATPTLSEDGVMAAFTSSATNVVALADLNGTGDVFLRNLTNDTTVLVSVNTGGTAAGNSSSGDYIVVSGDGRYVVFESTASDLTTNGYPGFVQNIFWRDTVAGVTRLVSVSTNGVDSGNDSGWPAAVSRDGRYVLFTSRADDLVAGDNNFDYDVFLRDMTTDTTTLVSVNLAATGPGDDYSEGVSMSADGRHLVFYSYSTNLTAGTVQGYQEVYVRDRVAGTTTLISRRSGTADGPDDYSYAPVISSDADVVAYYSYSTDIAPPDFNYSYDVFAFDLSIGTNELVSVGTGTTGNDYSYDQTINTNGTLVAFTSYAWNLVGGDLNFGDRDVFLYNVTNGTTALISVNTNGLAGNDGSAAPQLSASGRYVAFSSRASDLVSGDTNFSGDIFRRDTVAGITVLVSVNQTGSGSGNSVSEDPRLTPDGRYVAFESYASNLATNLTGGYYNIFLRDLSNSAPELISVGAGGAAPNGDSADESLSDDGRFVAFESYANNLGPADSGAVLDVYVRDRLTGTNILCSVNTNGTGGGDGESFDVILSANGRFIVFESTAGNLVTGDTNGTTDIFAYDTTLGTLQLVSVTAGGRTGNGASFLQYNRLNSSMTPDGRYVAFQSTASDLVGNDGNGAGQDIFVRDLVAGTTALVSVNCSATGSGDGDSYDPTLSADGRFVAFESYSGNLVAGEFIPGEENIFRRDLFTGTTELVSRNRGLTGGGIWSSWSAIISADGSGITFASYAYDLVNQDLNDTDDVFVWSGLVIPTSNCPPVVASQPQNRSASSGDNTSFNVTVNSCGASFYQWYFNGTPLLGANAATLSLLGVDCSEAGGYSVVLSNLYGAATSSVATLTITNNAPALLSPGGVLAAAAQMECTSLILAGGAAYYWNLTNATGTAGIGWDLVGVPGGVDVQATSSNQFTLHLISLHGGAGGPAANFDYNVTSTWNIVTSTAPVTNFSAAAFAVNTTLFSNDLAGGVFGVEEGSIRLRFDPNHAPLAGTMITTRHRNASLKINIASLLTNTTDPDGDVRTLLSVGATSTNGVPITFNATNILYPNATNNVADRISYTVRDVRAAYRAGDTVRTATGFIDISIAEPAGTNFNIVSITITSGIPTIVFAGIPGYAYDVQRTTNLVPPVAWSSLWTTNAPTNGLFQFTDPSPPTNSAFYRSAQP